MKIEELSSQHTNYSSSTTSTTSKNYNIMHETDKFLQKNVLDRVNGFLEKEEKDQLTKKEAEQIVKGINEFLKPRYTSLNFVLHEELDRYYVEVIDRETNKVIREIPEKELLDLYVKMTEFLGLFIDEKL